MPFAGYKDFNDCVAKNSSKDNPKAYCATIMRKVEGKKELKFTNSDILVKEDKGTFYSEGFIATTHPDKDKNVEIGVNGDILSETVIDQIVNTLKNPNESGQPGAIQVSYRHDWLKQDNPDLPPAGVNISVEKRKTDDGHWGAYAKTEVNSTFPDKENLIHDIEKKIISGYSIEYEPTNYDIVNLNGKEYRFREPKRIVDDIEHLVNEKGIDTFTFVDSVFNIPFKIGRASCRERV